ncbi:MAG: DUF2125 domain-containing protein, partial [Candidatus Devosia symbiotica]|nr:DUF2125 domain-containing protein [Candidatus Devosia symbiotica]
MKKRIIILGGLMLAVAVVWSLAWLVLAELVKQQIAAQTQADGFTAPQITCGTLNVGGFPFRLDADCAEFRVAMGNAVLELPGLCASIRIDNPGHLLVSALGPLQLTDTFTGSRNAVAWSALQASIRLDNWRIAHASVSGKNIAWSDTLMGQTIIAQSPLAEFHLFDIPEQHDADRHTAAMAGYALANELIYPGLTLTDTNAELQLELSGLPDDVRNWGAPDMLPALHTANGQLKIVSMHSTDAASTLDASGALMLDPHGQLDGQITISSTGVAERIGPLLAEPWRILVLGTPAPDGTYANQLNFRAGGVFSGLV